MFFLYHVRIIKLSLVLSIYRKNTIRKINNDDSLLELVSA